MYILQAPIAIELGQVPHFENKESSPSSVRRGQYNKPLREEAKRQIRRLIIDEGYTPHETMEILNIPRRTLQRYLSEAFLLERQVLSRRLTDDEVLNQLAFLEARVSKQRRDLLALANDKNADGKTRITAHKTASEMAAMIYKAYSEAAPQVLKGRATTFSQDRQEAKTNHYFSTTSRQRKSAPYLPEKYEQELEEQEQQEYDEIDASEDNGA
jgi:ParB-like chromosome segregation protein Spo0J